MAEKTTVARPYAKAVFALAREHGDLPAWSDMLQVAGRAVADPRVAALLNSPHVSEAQLVEVIAAPCRAAGWQGSVEKLGQNFLSVLAENRRLNVLPEISAIFEGLKAEVERIVEVTLSSATPVSDALKARFVAALSKRFGRDVHLHCEIDENLIGGAVIRAEDIVIDGSVRGRLEKLATEMTH